MSTTVGGIKIASTMCKIPLLASIFAVVTFAALLILTGLTAIFNETPFPLTVNKVEA